MITTKRSLCAVYSLILILLISSMCRADIFSVTSPDHDSYDAGPVTNALVDFTNWNPGGCAGVSPCIVGASIVPIKIFEDGFTTSVTFTYGPDFDFDYPTTGYGDRLLLQYLIQPQGLMLNLGVTGASFYQASAPQGIPDIGIPSSSGLSSCVSVNPNPGNYCYSFSQDLTASSGSDYADISLPYNTPGLNEVDVYLAVQGLNPDGGTFTITQDALNIAPEPSSLILLSTGLFGIAGITRKRLFGHD